MAKFVLTKVQHEPDSSFNQTYETSLLSLPTEIRRQIYQYMLPKTVRRRRGREVHYVWLRGRTKFMSTCKQIYEETSDMIYGENTFVVEIEYDRIFLRYRHESKSGFVAQETPEFLSFISERARSKIRHLVLVIRHIDSYTGMIKYNCGGPGLNVGISKQLQKLVDDLRLCGQSLQLRLDLIDWQDEQAIQETILRPLSTMEDYQDRAFLSRSPSISTKEPSL